MNWKQKLVDKFSKHSHKKSTGKLLSEILDHKEFFNPFTKYIHAGNKLNKYRNLGHYSVTLDLTEAQIKRLSPIKILNVTNYTYFTNVDVSIEEYDAQYVEGLTPKLELAVRAAIITYQGLQEHRVPVIDELYRITIIKLRDSLYNNEYDKEYLEVALELMNHMVEDMFFEDKQSYKHSTEDLKQDLDFIKKRKQKQLTQADIHSNI